MSPISPSTSLHRSGAWGGEAAVQQVEPGGVGSGSTGKVAMWTVSVRVSVRLKISQGEPGKDPGNLSTGIDPFKP